MQTSTILLTAIVASCYLLCSVSARRITRSPSPTEQTNPDKPIPEVTKQTNQGNAIPDVLHLFSKDGSVDVRAALNLNKQPTPAAIPSTPLVPALLPTPASSGTPPTPATIATPPATKSIDMPTNTSVPLPPSADTEQSTMSEETPATDSSMITILSPDDGSSSQDDQGDMNFGATLYLLLCKSLFSIFDAEKLGPESSSNNNEFSSIFSNASTEIEPVAPVPIVDPNDSDSNMQVISNEQSGNSDSPPTYSGDSQSSAETPPPTATTETVIEKTAESEENDKKSDQETGVGSVETVPITGDAINNHSAIPSPADNSITQSAPADSPPTESTPSDSPPAESAPAESAPAESAPAESAPAESNASVDVPVSATAENDPSVSSDTKSEPSTTESEPGRDE